MLLLITSLTCADIGRFAPARFHVRMARSTLLASFERLTLPGFFAGAVGSVLLGRCMTSSVVTRLCPRVQAKPCALN